MTCCHVQVGRPQGQATSLTPNPRDHIIELVIRMHIDTAQLIPLAIELAKIVAVAAVVLVFMLVAVLYIVLKLRWVIARIQSRLGPNRTGPWGVFQTVADALKLFQKEDIIPCGADRWLFTIAPAIVFIPAYLVYIVIPFGEGLTARSLNVGIIYISAISSIGVIGIVTAGWASNNKWSLLGAFRGASQLIAYEVPIILAVSVPVLVTRVARPERDRGQASRADSGTGTCSRASRCCRSRFCCC